MKNWLPVISNIRLNMLITIDLNPSIAQNEDTEIIPTPLTHLTKNA